MQKKSNLFFTGEWNAEEGVAARAATAAAAVEELLLLLFELPGGAARTEPPLLLSARRGGLCGDNGLETDGCCWSLNDNNLFLEHGESPIQVANRKYRIRLTVLHLKNAIQT